jgi:hypothetical protein
MLAKLSRLIAPALILVLAETSLHAQTIPRRADADKLLQDTVHRQFLDAVGNPPFHLVAHVRYDHLGTTKEGTYELLWAGPNRFKEELQLGEATETDIVLGDKIYILRNTPTLMPHFRYIPSLVRNPFYPTSLHELDTATVSRVYSDGKAGTPTFCVEPGDLRDARVCFDTATRQITFLHTHWGPYSSLKTLDQNDFISVEGIRYPRHVVHQNKNETTEISVEKLEKVADLPANAFVPRASSEVRDWCLHPVAPLDILNQHAPFPKTHPSDAFFPFYILIGRDGHIEKFVSLNPAAPPVDDRIENWIRKAQYPVTMCGNKPIKTERILMSPW